MALETMPHQQVRIAVIFMVQNIIMYILTITSKYTLSHRCICTMRVNSDIICVCTKFQ